MFLRHAEIFVVAVILSMISVTFSQMTVVGGNYHSTLVWAVILGGISMLLLLLVAVMPGRLWLRLGGIGLGLIQGFCLWDAIARLMR